MDRFFPPSHDADEPWFRLGNLPIDTTNLVMGLTLISILVWAFSKSLYAKLPFFSDFVIHGGEIWRIVTWPLANSLSDNALLTIIGLVFFYLFAHDVERQVGRVRFLVTLGVLTALPALIGLLVKADGFGIQMLADGVFLMFVLAHPFERSFFGIPMWGIGLVIFAFDALQYIGNQEYSVLRFMVLELLVSALATRALGTNQVELLNRVPFPTVGASAPPRPARGKQKKKSRRSGPATVTPIRSSPTSADLLRQAEVDILLDKINEHGINSLTNEERRRLDEHSRRMRDER
jgi:hypothetical protein